MFSESLVFEAIGVAGSYHRSPAGFSPRSFTPEAGIDLDWCLLPCAV